MASTKPEETFPIKSLHEFLSELDKEWGKFKSASIISILTACVLLAFSIFRFSRSVALGFETDYIVLFPFVIALLSYGIWMMAAQLRFLRKWERRMRVLVNLEEQLISGKLEND